MHSVFVQQNSTITENICSELMSFVNFLLLTLPLLLPVYIIRDAPHNVKDIFLQIIYLSIIAFIVTIWLIPILAKYTLNKGMYGLDINKKGTKNGEIKIPESLGIAVGIVFLGCGAIGQFWYKNDDAKV